MSRQEILDVLRTHAQQRSGKVGRVEFGVDEGPFENSACKYVAYHTENYQGDYYFNTLDEFLSGFHINGIPIGQLLDKISYFVVDHCDT